jgi:hypothetical protein
MKKFNWLPKLRKTKSDFEKAEKPRAASLNLGKPEKPTTKTESENIPEPVHEPVAEIGSKSPETKKKSKKGWRLSRTKEKTTKNDIASKSEGISSSTSELNSINEQHPPSFPITNKHNKEKEKSLSSSDKKNMEYIHSQSTGDMPQPSGSGKEEINNSDVGIIFADHTLISYLEITKIESLFY